MVQAPASRPRILVCDDDPMLPPLLRRFLEQSGFEVRVAADGDVAVTEADAAPPDLILMDLNLPRRDGYSVLIHLRGQPETRHTPVFIVSAEPLERHERISRELGASAYVEKPLDLHDLLSRIQTTLASGRARK